MHLNYKVKHFQPSNREYTVGRFEIHAILQGLNLMFWATCIVALVRECFTIFGTFEQESKFSRAPILSN
uniref:Uncharacterized protein n=1 Tax=Solanum tuberosum TaxID=4113 RepID=M1CAM9_SOLTU